MSDKKKYLSVSEMNKALPANVAERFSINDKIGNRTSTRSVFAKYGEVDFKTMSLARAEQLVKLQAPFITEKAKTPVSKNDDKSKTA